MAEDEEMLDDVEEGTTPAPRPRPNPAGAEGSGFLAKAWRAQDNLERKWTGLGRGRFARVLKMARKPEPEEFRQSATVVLVGIAIIGAIGFVMYLLTRWVLNTVLGV